MSELAGKVGRLIEFITLLDDGDAWGVEPREETLEVKVKFKEELASWIIINFF